MILGILAGLYGYAHSSQEEQGESPTAYAEYESGTVLQILADNCEADEVSEGATVGSRPCWLEVTSGQYKGETLMVTNAVGPAVRRAGSGGREHRDDRQHLFQRRSHRSRSYEYNRIPMILVVVALFVLVTVLVGGKTGAKSILGLALDRGHAAAGLPAAADEGLGPPSPPLSCSVP